MIRDWGYDARRTAQYCGKTGDASDVVGLPGIHIEVKRVERLNLDDAMRQAIHDAGQKEDHPFPAVFHRKSRGSWLVTMRAEDWADLYHPWERAKERDV